MALGCKNDGVQQEWLYHTAKISLLSFESDGAHICRDSKKQIVLLLLRSICGM